MKKYIKFWPIFALFLVIIIYLTYSRPRTIESILLTSHDKVFVHITDWIGAAPTDKHAELTEEEFNKVVEMMSLNKFRKTWDRKIHTSDKGSYYFITFQCYMSKTNETQTITLAKNGFIEINDCRYDVTTSVDEGQEMIHNIYEYISDILEEKPH